VLARADVVERRQRAYAEGALAIEEADHALLVDAAQDRGATREVTVVDPHVDSVAAGKATPTFTLDTPRSRGSRAPAERGGLQPSNAFPPVPRFPAPPVTPPRPLPGSPGPPRGGPAAAAQGGRRRPPQATTRGPRTLVGSRPWSPRAKRSSRPSA